VKNKTEKPDLKSIVYKHKKSIVFALKFFAIFSIAQSIIFFAPMNALTNFIAQIEANALGFEALNDSIIAADSVYVITNSCTGLVSWSILGAIIFSLKKPGFLKKALMTFLGGITLFILNLARVAMVIIAGATFNSNIAEIAHVISWFVMSGFVIGLWFILTKKATKIRDFSELL